MEILVLYYLPMKKLILLLGICVLASCSQEPAELLHLDSGWEYAPRETTHDDFSPLTGEQLHSLEDLLPEGEGVLWLKREFKKPSEKVLAGSELLGLFLGRITMADVTYLNGRVIGRTGRFPPDFFSEWNTYRHYTFPTDLLRERNTLLVKVYVGHEGALVDAPFLAAPQLSARHWRRQTFFANYLNMGISLVMKAGTGVRQPGNPPGTGSSCYQRASWRRSGSGKLHSGCPADCRLSADGGTPACRSET